MHDYKNENFEHKNHAKIMGSKESWKKTIYHECDGKQIRDFSYDERAFSNQ